MRLVVWIIHSSSVAQEMKSIRLGDRDVPFEPKIFCVHIGVYQFYLALRTCFRPSPFKIIISLRHYTVVTFHH